MGVIDYIEIINQSPQIERIIYKNYRQIIYKIHKIYILRIIHTYKKFNLKKELNSKNFPKFNN